MCGSGDCSLHLLIMKRKHTIVSRIMLATMEAAAKADRRDRENTETTSVQTWIAVALWRFSMVGFNAKIIRTQAYYGCFFLSSSLLLSSSSSSSLWSALVGGRACCCCCCGPKMYADGNDDGNTYNWLTVVFRR